jgi:hypothetical protein
METLILIVAGIIVLFVGIILLYLLFIGAVNLLAWAGESGFIGVAIYFACWVFMFPLMIVGSIISGALAWLANR